MSIKIDRFEPYVSEKGLEIRIDAKSIVLIKDHSTDKIIGMVNLNPDPDKNLELAEMVIGTIEEWIVSQDED